MIIEQNENIIDRFLRLILGGVCLIVPSYVAMSNIIVFILMIIGLYLMFSGLSGHDIFYRIFHIKTGK